MDETYAVNKLSELLSTRVAHIGLRCCAVREFGPVERAAASENVISGLAGWTFIFCALGDKTMRDRRCESYLFFSDGIEVDGRFEAMVEIVYRRLMEDLERKSGKSGPLEIPDAPAVVH